MHWEIIDANGTVYSGSEEEMVFIWDLITMDVDLLWHKYPQYTPDELMKKKQEHVTEWTGDLKICQILKIYR